MLTFVKYPVRIKLIVYGRGSDSSWLVGVVNGIPNSMLCLTSFLVLHSTTCGYVCIHQHNERTHKR